MITFWPSRAREGGLWQGENFWLHLLQPAHSVCVSLSAFFITYTFHVLVVYQFICIYGKYASN